MKNDDFGDRMKLYEQREAGRHLMPHAPVLARLDGRNFHAFTKHAKRPFSDKLHFYMVEVTAHLVLETAARVGYTQSDEITLAWYEPSFKRQMFFDGNVQKMCSTLAAVASVKLNEFALPRDASAGLAWHRAPTFDARVWNVPNLDEAVNAFVWRQQDAVRNSISMAAHAHFPHDNLLGLSGKQMQEKLFTEVGVNWNDYPEWAKRGTFVKKDVVRSLVTAGMSEEEIAALPPKHHARTNPELVVLRSAIGTSEEWLAQMAHQERVACLFGAEDVDPKCRRCSECRGEEHHWIEDYDPDNPEAAYICKHCERKTDSCDDCMGPIWPSRARVLGIDLLCSECSAS